METPIGNLPTADALDMSGLSIDKSSLDEILKVDIKGWSDELASIREHYASFGSKLPKGLTEELESLEKRLKAAR